MSSARIPPRGLCCSCSCSGCGAMVAGCRACAEASQLAPQDARAWTRGWAAHSSFGTGAEATSGRRRQGEDERRGGPGATTARTTGAAPWSYRRIGVRNQPALASAILRVWHEVMPRPHLPSSAEFGCCEGGLRAVSGQLALAKQTGHCRRLVTARQGRQVTCAVGARLSYAPANRMSG